MKKVLFILLLLIIFSIGMAEANHDPLQFIRCFPNSCTDRADRLLMDEYPDLEIDYSLRSDTREIIADLFAGDPSIDIICFSEQEGLSGYYCASNGALEDLLSYESIASQTVEYLDFLDQYIVNGKLYAVPSSFEGVFWYGNIELFHEMGIDLPKQDWTWEDFFALAEDVYAYNCEHGTEYYLLSYALENYPIQQFTANTVNLGDKTHRFDTEEFRALVENWKYWHDLNIVENFDLRTFNSNSFVKKNTLIYVKSSTTFLSSGIWVSMNEDTNSTKVPYRFIMPPSEEGMKAGINQGRAFGISRTSSQKHEAAYWISSFMSAISTDDTTLKATRDLPDWIGNCGPLLKREHWINGVLSQVSIPNSLLKENLDFWCDYVENSVLDCRAAFINKVQRTHWNQLLNDEINVDEYISLCVKLADQFLGE